MGRAIAWILVMLMMARPAAARDTPPINDSSRPTITIIANGQTDWTVRYDFARPVTRLAFDRSPDASRVKTWTAMPGFRISGDGGDGGGDSGEIVTRVDGKPFRRVDLRMPPRYRELPKDYAPFAPFGDGSILFHSARLFACGGTCPAQSDRPWPLRLIVRDGRAILLNGKTHARSVRWNDGDDGRYVYLGKGKPADAGVVSAVIDQALPDQVRIQLEQQLPVFMAYFSTRLGMLDMRPALFASYDAAHVGGWGRQGGNLPGQVFTHFYGNRWPAAFAKPDFTNELAWHFAHEAGHLYQRGIAPDEPSGWWVHEGGAEAFAALALRQSSPAAAAYVDRRIIAAGQSCPKLLKGTSLHRAITQQSNDPAYQCGLLINLAIDRALRQRAPDKDGLYTVWRAYLLRKARGQSTDEAAFLACIAEVGGQSLADQVARIMDAAMPDFTAIQ